MVSPRAEARHEMDSLTAELAARIVNDAFAPLQKLYNKGSSRATIDIKLSGDASRKVFGQAGDNKSLVEEIGSMTFDKAKATLRSKLGRDCKWVEIYRTDGSVDLKPGDHWDLTVEASFV